MNPHVVFGVVGIIVVIIGSFLAFFPEMARSGILKQTFFLSRESQHRLYPRALVRFIGVGQLVVGVILIAQWVFFAT